MAQPPTTPIISRELVRVIPFAAQKTFFNAALGNGATMVAEFDVGLAVTDRNQFLTGAFPGAANPQAAVGPNLDAEGFSTGAGTILIEFAIDLGCTYRTVATQIVPANAFTNVSALRITGRFARLTYTNTSGGAALVEFGAHIRSS